tara:strand:+ start:1357 stop:1530 length:174 start_codon:yes stop_codon:yes gene_type:complete
MAHERLIRMEMVRESIVYRIPLQFEKEMLDRVFLIRKDNDEIVIEFTVKPEHDESLQ